MVRASRNGLGTNSGGSADSRRTVAPERSRCRQERPAVPRPCGLPLGVRLSRRSALRGVRSFERRRRRSCATIGRMSTKSGTNWNSTRPRFYPRTFLYSRKPSAANNDAQLCHTLTSTIRRRSPWSPISSAP